MRPVTLNFGDTWAALREIERASHEADLAEIATNFSISNQPSQRVLIGSSNTVSTTGIGNGNDVTEDVLLSFTLPAGALSVAGEGVTIFAAGTLANNAHNKTVKLYFGSQVFNLGTVATANVAWTARMTVYRTGASAQLIICEGMYGAAPVAVSLLTGAETDTSTILIKVTGQTGTAAANDVKAMALCVSDLASDIGNAFATFLADCQKGGANRTL